MRNAAEVNVTSEELRRLRDTYVPAAYIEHHPMVAVAGDGPWVVDAQGRKYIDFAGGIAVLNIGQRHPQVVAALHEQLERLIHQGPVLISDKYILLAERIANKVSGKAPKQVLFLNSGAEAVENAVKIARHATGRPALIAFDHSFHGRTMLTSTLTGKVSPYKKQPGARAPEVFHAPYPYPYRPPIGVAPEDLSAHCLDALRQMLATRVAAEKVAAIIIEPIQGESGYVVPTPGFLKGVEALCREIGALFIVDEIQTGYGRTGRFLAGEWDGLAPDILTLGKSIADGLPLAAVVSSRAIFDRVETADIGGTFGGNPLACAAGLAVLDVFESEPLLENAARVEQVVRPALSAFAAAHPQVGEVRGLGALLALELVKDPTSKTPDPDAGGRIVEKARERGLILIKSGVSGNCVRVLVPLTAGDGVLQEGLGILLDAMRSVLD